MILESYKVICDECKTGIREFSYYPEEPDMLAYRMIVYRNKVFCCEECLKSYKEREKK